MFDYFILAMTVSEHVFVDGSSTVATELGSMLFTRCISGTRFVDQDFAKSHSIMIITYHFFFISELWLKV